MKGRWSPQKYWASNRDALLNEMLNQKVNDDE